MMTKLQRVLACFVLAAMCATGYGFYTHEKELQIDANPQKELKVAWMNNGVTNRAQKVILIFGNDRANIQVELGIREDGVIVGRVAE